MWTEQSVSEMRDHLAPITTLQYWIPPLLGQILVAQFPHAVCNLESPVTQQIGTFHFARILVEPKMG